MVRPLGRARLTRRHGLGFVQSEQLIRRHVRAQSRRYAWIGALGLLLLGLGLLCMFTGEAAPAWLRRASLGGAALCTGLHVWLAQYAAHAPILREAELLREGKRTTSPR